MTDLSYVSGISDTPLLGWTIGQALDRAAREWGGREALVSPSQDVRWTWAELREKAEAFAAGLLGLGLAPGDRIGIWSLNRAEWALTQFAAAKAGLVLVTINPAYRLSELEFALNKVGCEALVTATAFKNSDYMGMLTTLAPELATAAPGDLDAERLPKLRTVIQIGGPKVGGAIAFEDVPSLGGGAERKRLEDLSGRLQFDDPINIQFTSGTTGSPKGVTLTHHNILNNGYFVGRGLRLTEADRICIPVPLYHCFGMVMGVLGAVSKGAVLVFPGESFTAPATLDAIAEEHCTAVYGVPTMFVAMLEELERNPRDVSGLRTGIMAGAPCPADIMNRVREQMNMRDVTICYGMTETSPVSFQSMTDDPVDKRCETVGRIHPHLEARIIGPDGQIMPVGEQGELCTRGYSVMKGYWGDEEKTAESIRDGWMHTGDLAVLDEEGFCSIVGRVKDMIIRGGENIYPSEIEEFLIRHPGVSDVQVFGIPDETYGEEVCAWIIPRPGQDLSAESLKRHCQGQIAHYKIPRHFRLVEEIPMTITGKPQKFVMRDQMVEFLR